MGRRVGYLEKSGMGWACPSSLVSTTHRREGSNREEISGDRRKDGPGGGVSAGPPLGLPG